MAAARKLDPGVWMPRFLSALRQGLSIRLAAKAAGLDPGTAYYYRNRDPDFAARWQAALTPDGSAPGLAARKEPPGPRSSGWRIAFIEALAETSNVTAAAARAAVPLRTVYKTRRDDAGFAAKWLAALREGYDNLEIELLGYLRDPAPGRKMDVPSALRLLAAHRETVERQRALMEEDDEAAVRATLIAFLEGMRQRRLANEAILIEGETSDVAG